MFLHRILTYAHEGRDAAFDGKTFLTFAALWKRSEALAAYLLKTHPEKKPVAIFGDKEHDMLVCMVAAIKSGRPYVCIPSFYPEARILAILEEAEVELVLHPAAESIPTEAFPIIRSADIDRMAEQLADETVVDEANYVKGDELLCLLFTSGSTGKPKGVCISYNNMAEKIVQTQSFMEASTDPCGCRAMNLASYSFSAALSYIYYVMIYAGGTLYCVPRQLIRDTAALVKFMIDGELQLFSCTPSVMERLLSSPDFSPAKLPILQYCCLGGEPLSVELVKRVRERFPNIRLVNGYGATECTAAITTCEITDELIKKTDRYFPVGHISSGQARLMDKSGNYIREDGVIGEVIAVGGCVGLGYLHQPELTKGAFFTTEDGKPAYHTRDIAKTVDGYIYFIGREDNQIKIGGNRFELEDVESNLRQVSIVRECAAAVKKMEDGSLLLVGFVVKNDPTIPHMKAILTIRQEMAKRVESYMNPTKIVFVDTIPKNINLKLDRAALKEMAQNA